MLRPYGPGYIGATMKTNPTASSGFHTTRISPENIIAVGQYDSDGTLIRELPRDAWPE